MHVGFISKIGATELVLILLVALLVFGPSKLPQIGSAIGKGIRELRNAAKDIKDQVDVGLEDESGEGSKS
ncbi:MAG: twin-arginine translocase TatA/TatE family subunit [Bacillota bacterium]|jgi:sec-independent protein translocase protein TatA